MQHEACSRLCDDIAQLLVGLRPRTTGAVYAAACATRDLAAALHHALGEPENVRWRDAFDSLERFLAHCTPLPGVRTSAAWIELRTFLDENAYFSDPRFEEREVLLAAS